MKIVLDLDIGWGKQIKTVCEKFEILLNIEEIVTCSTGRWKSGVVQKAEEYNRKKMHDMCVLVKDGIESVKRKTEYVLENISNDTARNITSRKIIHLTRLQARALVMGQSGMLECANNFKTGCGGNVCMECGVIDNEYHRINLCKVWQKSNFYNDIEKINFMDIFDENRDF